MKVQVASQVAAQLAAQVAVQVASQVASEVASQVASQVAVQVAAKVAAQVAPLRDRVAELEAAEKKSQWLCKNMLAAAACSGDAPMMELLLQHTSMPVDYRAGGATLLCRASGGGHMAVVELLLRKGAEVNNALSNKGLTALYVASMSGHTAVVEVLLGKGADPSIVCTRTNGVRWTALQVAIQRGHQAVVDILTRHTAGH